MRPIRLAFQLHPQHADYDTMRRAAVEAEELGFDILYNWDHFFPLYGDADGAHFECWTQLASFAEVTNHIAIGPLVTCNSYRNPNYLADMARTVDHISGGRVILGIGAGWFEKDYEEYGYEFGTAGDRLRALDRDLPVIRERLGKLNPPPMGDMPIMVGGGGEKVTLRITAENADIWHGFGDPDKFRHKNGVLDEWCAKADRDPSEIERSGGVPSEQWDATSYGDAMVEAGAEQLTFGLGGPDYDLRPFEKWLAWRDERNRDRG
ncbi:MAG: LLM class F420-dependent oxidoreductase [Acidimicrobiia bacterium]|nr:LLM class F420-dependent oxidoreductase [Acidimicrobiia bacterium]